MILIIKHIDIEGPGTLGDFLKEHNEPFEILELGAGEILPADPRPYKAIVVLGGPMNVDEEDKYAFLKPELEFIAKALKSQVPLLGICLGSQLLAKAAGALVVKSPVKEIGWHTVELTADGKADPLFEGFSEEKPIYHWHGDMFHIPTNGKLLATATGCPHQALKVGPNAYGLQFHIEVTDRSIKEWCDEYCENDLPGRRDHAQAMLNDYYQHQADFSAQAQTLYRNFLKIIHAQNCVSTN
jgi:GMP synthase (glutamine-hydrolysing)